MQITAFPITRDPRREITLSLTIAALMALLSLAGILIPHVFYATDTLRRIFIPNDVVNLVVGLPGLVGAVALVRRRRWIGLLFWPGTLFYVTYTYIAYGVAASMPWLIVVYGGLSAVSAYAIFKLLGCMDTAAIQRRLAGHVPERLAGWVLVVMGGLFFLRAAWQVGSAITRLAPLQRTDLAVLVADLLITPFWIGGGILLLRRHPLGYSATTGLLFQASLLFVALLLFFVLQPFLTSEPFAATDFLVVFLMGMVCFVPLGLFVRGALRSKPS